MTREPAWDAIAAMLAAVIKQNYAEDLQRVETPEGQAYVNDRYRPFLENGEKGLGDFCSATIGRLHGDAAYTLSQLKQDIDPQIFTASISSIAKQLVAATNLTRLLTNIPYSYNRKGKRGIVTESNPQP